MHILILTAALPFPPDSGPQVKTFHMLQHLTQAHRVCLVSFAADADPAAAKYLRSRGVEVHTVPLPHADRHMVGSRRLTTAMRPNWTAAGRATQQLEHLVGELVREAAGRGEPFDLVHADQIIMAPFALGLNLPRLLDLHQLPWIDLEGRATERSTLERGLLQYRIAALQRATARIAARFDAMTVVSDDDRRALAALLPQRHDISVIPIAVDPKRTAPIARDAEAQAILSLMALWRATNAEGVRWFARDVYPLVRRQAPGCRLNICGADPPPEIIALAGRDATIRVTGHIDDPQPFIQTAGCLIVPLRSGGGMRVAILEALARGIPVVSTSIGCADLDLQPGEHLLVADTPSDFADAVGVVLREPDLGNRLAEAGRRQVVERYAWPIVCPTIDAVYTRMAQSVQQRKGAVLAPLGSRM